MLILTWLLTFFLVVDCLVLCLLVLIQLPKKEAGMGQAFGGSTTDALFGAGSGTALTKMTKYTAGAFFVLMLILSMMHNRATRSRGGDLRTGLSTEDKLSVLPPAAPKPATNAAAAGAGSNKLTLPPINAPTNAVPVEKSTK